MVRVGDRFRRAVRGKGLLLLVAMGLVGSVIGAQPSGLRVSTAGGLTLSLHQYGITWHFEEPVEYGQYVNGDYWVVGPVTVIEIDPAPVVASGDSLNGSMVNPEIGVQAYDSRTYMWDPSAGVSLPLQLYPGDSLVSSISDTSADRNKNMPLLTASVLTVENSAPSATAFRPTYIGTDKRAYDYASADLDLLPKLPTTAGFPSSSTIASDWERRFQRPWILHGSSWMYGRIMPSENGHWYHQNQIMSLSGAAVLLVSDWADKETLLIRYLQTALDYYSVHYQSGGGPYYYRWPIIFAGIILGEPDMRDLFVDSAYTYTPYHDSHLYFRDDPRLNRTQWSAIVPSDDTWTRYEERTGKAAVFYAIPDIGRGNATHHEHLHPSEWGWIEDAGYSGGGAKQETYRRMHSVGLVGFSLSALAMNAQGYLANDAFIPYTDRWMSEDAGILETYGYGASSTHPAQTSKMSFVDEMWFEHRPNHY